MLIQKIKLYCKRSFLTVRVVTLKMLKNFLKNKNVMIETMSPM